jgi:hypothetical protein
MTFRVTWDLGDKERNQDFTHIMYAEIFAESMLKQCNDVKITNVWRR